MYQWSDLVTTVLVAGGRRRTIADRRHDYGRSSVDANAAGISMIAAAVDGRRFSNSVALPCPQAAICACQISSMFEHDLNA